VRLLVATRSGHKLHEIRTILREAVAIDLIDLNDAGVEPTTAEDDIEVFDTFEENAVAKARYFQGLTEIPTVADDSGLVVDALDGAPGVRSKRYAPNPRELDGGARDRENLEHLLRELGETPLARRTARYLCVAALVEDEPSPPKVFTGVAEGLILGRRRGRGGFGYDPVFYDQPSGKTFAELTREEKNSVSHRGRAFRALAAHLSSEYRV
jgi:XTP/dITP diphosphohydrolase